MGAALPRPPCAGRRNAGSQEVPDLDPLLLEFFFDPLYKGQRLGPVSVDAQSIALDLDLLASDRGDLVLLDHLDAPFHRQILICDHGTGLLPGDQGQVLHISAVGKDLRRRRQVERGGAAGRDPCRQGLSPPLRGPDPGADRRGVCRLIFPYRLLTEWGPAVPVPILFLVSYTVLPPFT